MVPNVQVKTELVAQVWHNSVMATPEQIVRQVTHVFGPQLAPHEEARYNELLQAATNPTYRQRYSNFGGQSIAEGVRRFARGALDAMGPTLLEIINNDVNMGRYNPGVPPSPPPDVPRPQPIRPAPMRAVAPEPSNGLAGGYISPLQPYTSPQQYTAPQSVRPAAPGLNEAVAALRNAGGVDPIQGVMQQAALATAMAAKQNNPSSTPFAPAMESPDAGLGVSDLLSSGFLALRFSHALPSVPHIHPQPIP